MLSQELGTYTLRVLETPELSSHERLVLLGLAKHAANNGTNSYPSQATLAAYTALSARSVARALTSLKSQGIITERGTSDYGTKVYDLCSAPSSQTPSASPSSPTTQVDAQTPPTPDRLASEYQYVYMEMYKRDDEGRDKYNNRDNRYWSANESGRYEIKDWDLVREERHQVARRLSYFYVDLLIKKGYKKAAFRDDAHDPEWIDRIERLMWETLTPERGYCLEDLEDAMRRTIDEAEPESISTAIGFALQVPERLGRPTRSGSQQREDEPGQTTQVDTLLGWRGSGPN